MSGHRRKGKAWGLIAYFRRGRRWAILLICLLFSALLWLIFSMNGVYTKRVLLPVAHPIELPVQFAVADSSRIPQSVTVDITASGSTLFHYTLETLFSRSPKLHIGVDSVYMDPDGGRWLVSGSRLREEVLNALPTLSRYFRDLGNAVELQIYPSEVSFAYAPLTTRTMPVAFTSQVDFGENANFLLTDLTLEPDIVKVYGIRETIDSLQLRQPVLETDTLPLVVEQAGVSSYKVALQAPKGVKMEPDSVMVAVAVEELLYHSEKISSIQVEHLPEGYSLRLFPSTIFVSYLAPRDSLRGGAARSSLALYVDANEITGETKELEVRFRSFPSYAHTLQLEPDRVEFLLEEETTE